jgi:hypothetical protein
MKTNDIIDHHLYEVRLIVAIPDYGMPSSSAKYSALDAIVPQITAEDVVILGMTEKELTLTDIVQTTTLIAPITTTSTTTTVVSASRKPRTLADVPNGHQRWTKLERKCLTQWLKTGVSVAQMAKALGRTEKAVALQIWHMKKGK